MGSASIGQVDQWVWPSLSIPRRSPGAAETHSLVEADSLVILLVYVRRHVGMQREPVPHQCRADSSAMECRVDEQSLHVSTVYKHEGKRAIVLIGDKPEGRLGEKTAHLSFNRDAILAREEVVRCVDRLAPDPDNPFTLVGAGEPDRKHQHSMPQ